MSLEETQAERDQKEIMKVRTSIIHTSKMLTNFQQDLGPDVRNWITSVDKGRRTRTNVNQLLAGRECNQEGTEAARFASTHKSQIIEWHSMNIKSPKDRR